MIVQRCLTLTITICLIVSANFGEIKAERWSRQVSNSEWIPLTNPRVTQTQAEQNGVPSGSSQLPQLPSLSLSPALQHQYQEQLLQLQKTQENIQKLLLLQQQLKAQQQLLQSQTFLPTGFSNADEDKQPHQGRLEGSQDVGDLASEDLLPPLPASEALPPVFPAQNFFPPRPRVHPPPKQDTNLPQEFSSLSGQEFKNSQLLQQGEIEEDQRQGAKLMKENNQPPLVPQGEINPEEEEEVQLVYVPAETLAQRGQPKRGRGRKQYPPLRQHQQQLHQSPQHQQQSHQSQQHHSVDNLHEQNPFAQHILQQIQLEREEKAKYLKEERMKEIARLNEEQAALERKNRLQQEALQREQELQRQREEEKKKKEMERLEELAKQRELERIREAREKQRLEELERRRLAEVRSREEKRRAEEAARQREAERLAALERQKELEVQQALKQRQEEARLSAPDRSENQDAQPLSLIRDQQQQFHRQHLTETSKPVKSKVRGRHRQRPHYQEQQSYRETTTAAPSPNQPPLSVYMGSPSSQMSNVKVADVLKILKDAKTIAVLDTVGPDTPRVFVGPTNLDPPSGYAKFDLPYLSSIDHNRVERKVDKLPFFVAPLSFDPPPGYSKIPFPAPHIGSVVVNTLDNTDPKETDIPNPSPTPLIEPNSYQDGLNRGSESTTSLYEPQTTLSYSQEPSTTSKYEQTYSATPSSGFSSSRFRFKQYYGDDKPAPVVSSSFYDDQRTTTRKYKYHDENTRSTEAADQSPKVETSVVEEVSYSTTPSFKEETIDSQDPSGQLALINEELARQRDAERYNNVGQYNQQNSQASSNLGNSFDVNSGDINDVRNHAGPTQYSLPAELPAISPHLPGLVNSLLDKNETKHNSLTTTTSTTTTTTTTQRSPTTTYRPRSRQRTRVGSSRPRTTTQSSSTRTNVDRNRRPYNRSRSRFSTTTEEYRESAYEPTKSRIPETTVRYNVEHRRPTSRTQKHRNRDKSSQQAEVQGHSQHVQTHQSYDSTSHDDSSSPQTSNPYLQTTGSESDNLRQLDSSSSLNNYSPENYPSTTASTTENYPSFHEVTVNQGSALASTDYTRSQNYPQTIQEDSQYRPNYEQAVENTDLERTPVNGFNYQVQGGETMDQGIVQRPKDYQLDGKVENSDFEVASSIGSTQKTMEDQRYSSIYDVKVPQTQPEYSLTGQDSLSRLESEKIQANVPNGDLGEQPIFVPLSENKQDGFEPPILSTELPVPEITTEITTTSTTPVVIRQRLRGRVGTRLSHEPSVQTRNRNSQDEYVRFNAVNQDSSRISSSRQRVRSRTRPQTHTSHVQTDGNEYIKIHAAQQQRPIVTTTSAPTTTTPRPVEEDVDYGFIRPPNFKPVHPVDTRFPAPITYRPQVQELPQQPLLTNDETAIEPSAPQSQLLKNRQKYQSIPSRRLQLRPTTLPPPTTIFPETTTTTERVPIATVLPEDAIYTTRPKSRPDDSKQVRIRGRVRRPSRKRVTTTTTTESVLEEAHNELPLDENYPRILPQSVTTEQQQQQTLFDDNYDAGDGFSGAARNPTENQFYETSSENYPQDFILNFGNYPTQPVQREEYDQTQLASDSRKKYVQSSRGQQQSSSAEDHSTTVDIYGEESQWSTKLTRTSFQPSFAMNRVEGESSKKENRLQESKKQDDQPEIITAAPEASSVTLLVSADYKKSGEEEDVGTLMETTVFGRKTNSQDRTEKMNETEVTTANSLDKNGNGSDPGIKRQEDSWMMDRGENSTDQRNFDSEKTVKKNENVPIARKTGRRRRVRVRVRPAVDDFVTAESQHYNSALNGLFRGEYKYNPSRQSKSQTVDSSSSEKSSLEEFLTEILKNTEEPLKITTTEVPEVAWTMTPIVTTPIIPQDVIETTEIPATTVITTEKADEPITLKPEEDSSKIVDEFSANINPDEKEREEKRINYTEKRWEMSKGWKRNNLKHNFNFGSIAEKYSIKNVERLNEDSLSDRSDEASKTIGAEINNSKGKENFSESLNREEYYYPKNHRAEWSEVKYPSGFDHSQSSSYAYEPKTVSKISTTSIPGLITKNKGDSSERTLSDYVQAIFDTMKNSEEETTVGNTEIPDEMTTTVQPPQSETDFPLQENLEVEKDLEARLTTPMTFEETQTVTEINENLKDSNQTTVATFDIDLENSTTLEREDTASENSTSSSSQDFPTDFPPTTTTTITKTISTTSPSNSTQSMLGKVLRTSTTTKVSHMTEICYRGRCVMTKPSRDDRHR